MQVVVEIRSSVMLVSVPDLAVVVVVVEGVGPHDLEGTCSGVEKYIHIPCKNGGIRFLKIHSLLVPFLERYQFSNKNQFKPE